MQEDFHYYATYCAAILAGYSHEESLTVCYSAQLVDLCSETLLNRLHAPTSAATTQLSGEMADARMDLLGLQKTTRIWASFHFLPGNLYAEVRGSRQYRNKYRMICQPNSDLLVKTVELARGKSLQAAGVAMHVLADTWAHRNFAGTPSLVINNTDFDFWELTDDGEQGPGRRRIRFRHNPGVKDDPERGVYLNSIYQANENSVMNLGHGRAGHLPDYSFLRYEYVPAWAGYEAVIKDNPRDYEQAFCQMVYALRALREQTPFEKEQYDREATAPYLEAIRAILRKRQLIASDDWKALGEQLSGQTVEDFDLTKYQQEYLDAPADEKNGTFLGRFILAALAQKSTVTGEIFRSGNRLAGFSVTLEEKGFRGIRDFRLLVDEMQELQKQQEETAP